jgi:hypothetical protein
MPYLECVNEEFQHYFIVDYPTNIPYNLTYKCKCKCKKNKNTFLSTFKKKLKLF